MEERPEQPAEEEPAAEPLEDFYAGDDIFGFKPKPPIQWKLVIPIFVVGMIVLPLVAGFLTYFVMSR